ncbi:MAG TPA: hypothetical protein PK490_18230, partial [Prosthecobacter sp.]|nr:hypothetical protein [Prosthecobacter sp.]HRK16226.1 hypothetical protein [Prosthecobacter sp.]
MKNLLLVLIGLATLGSVLALAWVLGTPAAPDPRVAQLEAELKEARRTIATLKRDLEKRELP